jgi:hypothetical protein
VVIKVTGIDIDSNLANRLDSLDETGDGEVTECNPEDVRELLALFIEQGQGTFTVEWE